jgi:hypothetical protein
MKELRSELNRLQAEFDQKWSSQIKLVNPFPTIPISLHSFRLMQTIEVYLK